MVLSASNKFIISLFFLFNSKLSICFFYNVCLIIEIFYLLSYFPLTLETWFIQFLEHFYNTCFKILLYKI